MENIYGLIYKVTDKFIGKSYIGQTTSKLEKRLEKHYSDGRVSYSKKSVPMFSKLYYLAGKDKFTVEVIEDNIPKSLLDEKEIYYIELYDTFYNGYNQTKGGFDTHNSYLEEGIVKNIISDLMDVTIQKHTICRKYKITPYLLSDINTGSTWFDKDIKYPIRENTTKHLDLTDEKVIEIKNMLMNDATLESISTKIGCSNTTISKINRGEIAQYRVYGEVYPLRKTYNRSKIDENGLVYIVDELLKSTPRKEILENNLVRNKITAKGISDINTGKTSVYKDLILKNFPNIKFPICKRKNVKY